MPPLHSHAALQNRALRHGGLQGMHRERHLAIPRELAAAAAALRGFMHMTEYRGQGEWMVRQHWLSQLTSRCQHLTSKWAPLCPLASCYTNKKNDTQIVWWSHNDSRVPRVERKATIPQRCNHNENETRCMLPTQLGGGGEKIWQV